MKLTCKPLMQGIMAYWDEVPEAAGYNIMLFINNQMISKRTNDRTELYCSFSGLAAVDGSTQSTMISAAAFIRGVGVRTPPHSGLDYYVQVEAENRNGDIIDSTEKIKCAIREF